MRLSQSEYMRAAGRARQPKCPGFKASASIGILALALSGCASVSSKLGDAVFIPHSDTAVIENENIEVTVFTQSIGANCSKKEPKDDQAAESFLGGAGLGTAIVDSVIKTIDVALKNESTRYSATYTGRGSAVHASPNCNFDGATKTMKSKTSAPRGKTHETAAKKGPQLPKGIMFTRSITDATSADDRIGAPDRAATPVLDPEIVAMFVAEFTYLNDAPFERNFYVSDSKFCVAKSKAKVTAYDLTAIGELPFFPARLFTGPEFKFPFKFKRDKKIDVTVDMTLRSLRLDTKTRRPGMVELGKFSKKFVNVDIGSNTGDSPMEDCELLWKKLSGMTKHSAGLTVDSITNIPANIDSIFAQPLPLKKNSDESIMVADISITETDDFATRLTTVTETFEEQKKSLTETLTEFIDP